MVRRAKATLVVALLLAPLYARAMSSDAAIFGAMARPPAVAVAPEEARALVRAALKAIDSDDFLGWCRRVAPELRKEWVGHKSAVVCAAALEPARGRRLPYRMLGARKAYDKQASVDVWFNAATVRFWVERRSGKLYIVRAVEMPRS